MPVDARARRLLDMLAAAGDGSEPPPDVETRRAALSQLATVAGGSGPALHTVCDLTAEPGGPPVRLYDPEPQADLPGLLYVHGGGWTCGGLDTHDTVCRILAASGRLRVLAVDYRRPPEHPRPAAIKDASMALDWLAKRAGPVGVAGDSAGAHIAAELALSRPRALRLQLLVCPILDPAGHSASRRVFERGWFIDPQTFAADRTAYFGAQPVSMLEADVADAPAALIHLAEFDPFRDEGRAYAERLAAAGRPVQVVEQAGMIHYFYALSGAIPAARPLMITLAEQVGGLMRG